MVPLPHTFPLRMNIYLLNNVCTLRSVFTILDGKDWLLGYVKLRVSNGMRSGCVTSSILHGMFRLRKVTHDAFIRLSAGIAAGKANVGMIVISSACAMSQDNTFLFLYLCIFFFFETQ